MLKDTNLETCSLPLHLSSSHHLVANALTHLGSFSDAKQHEKKAYDIYKNKVNVVPSNS